MKKRMKLLRRLGCGGGAATVGATSTGSLFFRLRLETRGGVASAIILVWGMMGKRVWTAGNGVLGLPWIAVLAIWGTGIVKMEWGGGVVTGGGTCKGSGDVATTGGTTEGGDGVAAAGEMTKGVGVTTISERGRWRIVGGKETCFGGIIKGG